MTGGMEIVTDGPLGDALTTVDLPHSGAVVAAVERLDDWEATRSTLMRVFEVSRRAAQSDASIVYVVHGDDLLGRRGAPSAMAATGILSAARTAAIELSRKGAVVNVVAVGDDTPPDTVARWVGHLFDPHGPTGELIRLDASHLGKALP